MIVVVKVDIAPQRRNQRGWGYEAPPALRRTAKILVNQKK